MAEIVNLNRLRKERTRQEKRLQADANAARFGQTKAERDLGKARIDKATQKLDAHKREENPGEA
ncbi:DUF4169 family protein [Xinfangfangia sp. D13-10-4-6]|uniref:DUF4169 family protein n=1 Tax=Pseudogemmobacter hezensis TaxID=2737662 RepID=UPI001554958C|nr:DUF4169 family protein [Pseudogemmobacter hezensis]NPD13634.1 DUF4169 family protein [Pseudogemmobacter hezensis]